MWRKRAQCSSSSHAAAAPSLARHPRRTIGPPCLACRSWLWRFAVCCVVNAAWAQPAAPTRHVVVTEIDGIIHPITSEYFTDAIDAADTSGAELVVLVLRTPGGLLDSTRTMVSRMITSRAPVVVFVGPSGARAASAGFILLMAADVAAMAPATHAGAAHPVSGSGEKMDETTSQKAAADAAAYVRTIAEARGRNVSLAADAVLQSRAFTDREALEAMPALIDLSAKDVDDLLLQLEGRTIKRFDGRTTDGAHQGRRGAASRDDDAGSASSVRSHTRRCRTSS